MHKYVAVVLLFLLVACQTQQEQPPKVKIGIMTITTGPLAFLGENIVRSAELAAEELGYAGHVEFIVEDVGNLGQGETTVTAYKKLVEVDEVKVIIDGMTSDGTLAVSPLLEQDKVVMITPLTGGNNIDEASEYLFRNGPSDIIAGTKPAADILATRGLKRVALFTDDAEYTRDISAHFRSAFLHYRPGIEGILVVDEVIIPDQTDYRTELLKLQGKEYDAVVINTATGTSANYLIKQLGELGNTKLIFANFIAWSNLVTVAGNYSEGVYIYDPEFDESAQQTVQFFAKYQAKYTASPAIPFHSTGTYDALKMSVQAVDAVGYDGQKVHDWLLANVKNWQGLNGVVSFDEKGNTQTGFVLKQVVNGSLQKV